jgi:hypothetical protein
VISRRAIDAYVRAALAADPVRADWRHDTEWNALAPDAVHVPVLLLQGELDPSATAAASCGCSRGWVRSTASGRDPRGDHAALLEDTAPRMIAAIRAFIERP